MALSGKVVKFVYLLTGTQPADPQEDTIYFSHEGKCIYVGDEKIADTSPSFEDIESYVDSSVSNAVSGIQDDIIDLQGDVNTLSEDMYGWQDEQDPSGIIYDIKQEISNTPKWIVVDSSGEEIEP